MAGVSTQAVRKWRYEGKGPRYIRLPTGAVRYPLDDLVRWLEQGSEGPEE